MTFLTLVFKNIWRHRMRTVLTILGISIGVATVVMFGMITAGLKDAFGTMIKSGQTDFTVAKAGAADMILSFLDAQQIQKIQETKGVAVVVPYVLTIVSYEGNPYFLVGGINPGQLELSGVKIIAGKTHSSDGEVLLGKLAAKNKKLNIGSEITLNKNKYQISGIFESGLSYQDAGAIAAISEAQKLQGIKDQVNMVSVKVKDGFNVDKVAQRIEKENSDLATITNVADLAKVDPGIKMTDQITWVISLMAILIGGIVVMNTIVMSVYERTREIGVLRALGWSQKRVVAMILGESQFLGIFAAIFGTIIGFVVIYLLRQTEFGEAWLVVKLEWITFWRAILVSQGTVFLASIYPSLKAARLLPTEALRYE